MAEQTLSGVCNWQIGWHIYARDLLPSLAVQFSGVQLQSLPPTLWDKCLEKTSQVSFTGVKEANKLYFKTVFELVMLWLPCLTVIYTHKQKCVIVCPL